MYCCSPTGHLIRVLALLLHIHTSTGQDATNPTGNHGTLAADLEAAASATVGLTANSHKIIADGWPKTSPLWPSIEMAGGKSADRANGWFNMVDPFIYADKPRAIDYSLLLDINQTVLDLLKRRVKPMSVNLSFEYYFDHDAKATAPPGIKIEVDRKQFKYLEPNEQADKARMWLKFAERISITDPSQLDNHDWLKFSLVNRQSPSLVAIRHLQAEFLISDTPADSSAAPKTPEQPVEAPKSPQPPAPPTSNQRAILPDNQPPVPSGIPQAGRVPQAAPPEPQALDDPGAADSPGPPGEQDATQPDDQVPAASNVLTSTIKPVSPKKQHWGGWGKKRRKKRQVSQSPQTGSNSTLPDSIKLTCFRGDQCDWRADASEDIQWSLARMPPSTTEVQSGYYYVSNRNKYGDSTKLLRLSLNQTETATIADQNSDHCVELGIYVTERTYLKLYRLLFDKDQDGMEHWNKANLLMTWAPTVATEAKKDDEKTLVVARKSLPPAHLAAMENGHNGWTLETLCYGDFFASAKDCGSGKCVFGFEMETEVSRHLPTGEQSTPSTDLQAAEQVVGVSLLREFTTNIPLKASRPRWLETWQRDEVEPADNWRFYPKLDHKIGPNNVSLVNLYDDAQYFIESDWIEVNRHLDFTATLAIEFSHPNGTNSTDANSTLAYQPVGDDLGTEIFSLKLITRLVDTKFDSIYTNNSTVDWTTKNNETLTLFNLGFPLTDHILNARNGQLVRGDDDGLFKIVLELILDCHWLSQDSPAKNYLTTNEINYSLTLANVSVSDRCSPNPCQFGGCQQNGTGYEDWSCVCDEKHRGRRCEFGRWCNLPHISPWSPSSSAGRSLNQITLKPLNQPQPARQPKVAIESVTRISGKDYCQRKLGSGSKCSDIDLPLNDNLYTEEDKTFICSCQDDYYLSDDSKCKQAHLCNSVVCPVIGMVCDESKPFNRTQPCQCNERQDWYPDPQDPLNKCVRRQCHDKQRDCGFDAHICLPTLPGERPICKCGPKFTLKTNERGQKSCQSTACVLPTLNDCDQICLADSANLERPFKCACHPGYVLAADGRNCRLQRPNSPPHCKWSCNMSTQICTDLGCKCRQGYIGEGEVIVSQTPKYPVNSQNGSSQVDYVRSIRCLNVCSLTYAENKNEFEMIESVCPLGLCDPSTFQCRCADLSSSALINTKYEPVYANNTDDSSGVKRRASPLCHLRRVCEPESSSYKICKSQGAICVPDYTKAAMFDCICPPSTEKKFYGQGTSSEFTCEPKCSSKRYDCLRRQAVCKQIDRDQVRCDCLPGLMFDRHDSKCYLAKFSYAFNLLVVNKYYEPESKFHKLEQLNTSENNSSTVDTDSRDKLVLYEAGADGSQLDKTDANRIVPQFQAATTSGPPVLKSIFISDYNQCNITQVIPKSVIEDPYEHDIESFLGYIDQCNEKIHQNVRNYHLNSALSEDLRQSLRQHLRDFSVTTNNSTCFETDTSGMYLNCTIYLQSNEPIAASTVEYVFNECDNHGQNNNHCWIKPRLLLKKPTIPHHSRLAATNNNETNRHELNFRQVIPCEIDNFCGQDAHSFRLDDNTSLCSCKCPQDIEVVDVKDLEPRRQNEDPGRVAVKEVCAPRNLCGANSTICLGKTGSTCQYDIRLGSRCICVYPAYEDAQGRCFEVAFNRLDTTLIVIIIMLGTGLIVSIAVNLVAVFKSRSLLGRSKQYPLNEFPPSRPNNRSTGVPNPVFTND